MLNRVSPDRKSRRVTGILKALLTGPGLDQRAILREVLVGKIRLEASKVRNDEVDGRNTFGFITGYSRRYYDGRGRCRGSRRSAIRASRLCGREAGSPFRNGRCIIRLCLTSHRYFAELFSGWAALPGSGTH
jgi:hypothetical protein